MASDDAWIDAVLFGNDVRGGVVGDDALEVRDGDFALGFAGHLHRLLTHQALVFARLFGNELGLSCFASKDGVFGGYAAIGVALANPDAFSFDMVRFAQQLAEDFSYIDGPIALIDHGYATLADVPIPYEAFAIWRCALIELGQLRFLGELVGFVLSDHGYV